MAGNTRSTMSAFLSNSLEKASPNEADNTASNAAETTVSAASKEVKVGDGAAQKPNKATQNNATQNNADENRISRSFYIDVELDEKISIEVAKRKRLHAKNASRSAFVEEALDYYLTKVSAFGCDA